MTRALLLGTAQDAGVPQAGCRCDHCASVRRGEREAQYAVSLALLEQATGRFWLLDATPDFKQQLALVEERCALAGIVLSHAHIGHYSGLMHLGREAMNSRALPVYGSRRMLEFLRRNAPWSQLVALGNIRLQPFDTGEPLALGGVKLTPVAVPHRAEFSDTHAFLVQGSGRRLFYCPDIDSWAAWERDLRSFLQGVDVALLDATFYSADELPGRELHDIPHPPVTDTVRRLRGCACEVHLIHLNHSNPLYTDAELRARLERQGFALPRTGTHWSL